MGDPSIQKKGVQNWEANRERRRRRKANFGGREKKKNLE